MAASANVVPNAIVANIMPKNIFVLDFLLLTLKILMVDYRYKKKKVRMKMKNLMVIMNRAELADIMYPANAECGPDTLVGIAALGGDLLDEARANGNMVDQFCAIGDEGEFIEVDADGYIISDFLYY